MTSRQQKLQRRATKAGIKAARSRHHVLSAEEILSLKVQVVPALPRWAMGLTGIAMVAAGVTGTLVTSNTGQALLAIFGLFLGLFGLFGIKRSLEGIFDRISHEVASEIIDRTLATIIDAVDF